MGEPVGKDVWWKGTWEGDVGLRMAGRGQSNNLGQNYIGSEEYQKMGDEYKKARQMSIFLGKRPAKAF